MTDKLLSDPGVERAARALRRSASLLALSVLADSSVEHYRGSFDNPAMSAPLAASLLSLAAGLHGMSERAQADGAGRRLRRAAHAGAAAVGVAGGAFHLYNVLKRQGRFSWHNLFYGAPLGAPFALALSGALGLCAERLDTAAADGAGRAPTLAGLPAGRALAALTAAGLTGTVAEATLLHFRGSFQNPAMFAPVVLPPVAAALTARAACGAAAPVATPRRRHRFTRFWLRLTTALGFAGVGFHAYGVARSMGGWRNWSQNLLSGPPLPAPPAFAALASAGLAALDLIEGERR